ncbi:MAG: PP2C family protein-serine/threonine phosphatase, partial [Thermoanaerobaculia bacterium]
MDEAAVLRAALRHDALSAPIGFLLLGLGLAAGALALARRKSGDPALAFFSLSTSLYALRLLADTQTAQLLYAPPEPAWHKLINCITYTLPVPAFLFFERVIGPGWRSSVHRLWQIHAALALVAIPWEIVSPTAGPALGIYRMLVLVAITVVLANLFAPRQEPDRDLWLLRGSFLVVGVFIILENLRALGLTPWRDNAEPVGFLIFNCGLGVIAARRIFDAQERLTSIRQELETARRIQRSILPEEAPRIAGLDLAARYISATEVAGDFYDFLPGEGRRTGVLIADVSGHGVPAALVASMLKVAAAAEIPHAASPGRVLSEMNQIFHGKLRNQFITAFYVFFDLEAGRLTWSGAGHPPALLWRGSEGKVEELAPGGPVMGRLRRAVYGEESLPLEPGDRLLLFTDGIPEALSPAGEPFGDERLQALLAAQSGGTPEQIAEALLARVAEWTGRSASFDDDLTFVVAGVTALTAES